ncbi:hypothetical protein FQN60_002075 [Etheostoma spectabile]|uniref:Uncharacterized protein n=1 Tax=Etheostoma spectabile TaxID=54343 RepID=A0A5J5D906_9PERO|nr:hypothetical protein FQN60_002075 [Etheostoma spectabile]
MLRLDPLNGFKALVIWQQFVLPVAEGEGQKCQEDGVQDADDGQDVGPAYRTVPQAVLIRLLTTHPFHLWRVPAVRKKNKLKQTIVPTISSMEVPTKNMAVLKAGEGMELKSNTLPLQMSSEVSALPMQ